MRLLLLPIAALSAALVGCTTVQEAVQVPTFEVQSARLNSLSLLGTPTANITLRVKMGNPNGVPVRLANIASRLILDGQDVGTIDLPNVNLPARGEAVQDANLILPLTVSTGATFLKIARGQEASYRLDGTFTADLGILGQPSFGPFTLAQGVWKQPAILPF
ncbi:Water stress and hypersensitive response domain-containing protein [Deinococcus sp. Arct2-2]|uniref:LEA type 2 family protein n=1 Tax=Deinococcus sp. Arct2-2 TaxID=2568653 RepID=UPI0010A2FEC0|nr:LEA type 2 family protein [Deinococcus sp. Arct2-2]THF69416.1 Water stress and hypersensitive response domain-containing protein [Deinococcus sp. Arct2-2]